MAEWSNAPHSKRGLGQPITGSNPVPSAKSGSARDALNMKKLTTTCAIITNNKDEILLVKRGREPYKGKWSLISGIGESRKGLLPEEAILGEVRGDIGAKFLNSERVLSMGIGGDQLTDEVIIFRGNIEESEIKLKPIYSEEYKWIPLDKALLEDLAFEHNDILEEYITLLK